MELAGKSERSLAQIALLQGLPEAELTKLAGLCRWRDCTAEQEVVGHLEPSTEVFFVVEGRLRATIYSSGGREVAFRDFKAGEFFGDLAAIDGRPRSASVVALAPSVVAALPAVHFRDLLERNPQVTHRILLKLVAMVRELTERVFEFSAFAVRHRIHAELLRLALSGGGDSDREATISPAPTHQEIANRISTHREAVSREMQILTKAGLLRRERGRLIVSDLPRLRQMVEEVMGLEADEVRELVQSS